ncbi:MAG: hypothetical protein HGA22_11115, partial [Clostridiales bacterium]|nr:hypothetical protein [Clostridiales bacterium]
PQERQQTVTSPVKGVVERLAEGLLEGARVKQGDFILEIKPGAANLKEQLQAQLRDLQLKMQTSNIKAEVYTQNMKDYSAARDFAVSAAEEMIDAAQAKLDADYSAVVASVHIDSNDAKVISIAANSFTNDIQLISGKKLPVLHTLPSNCYTIIAGKIGQSKLIDDLITSKQLDVNLIKNKWECFIIKVVGKKLLIAGSDPRGTAYGIFHLSRKMGVSPWVWWADATPQKRKQLYVNC